jgi:hypothetical protein
MRNLGKGGAFYRGNAGWRSTRLPVMVSRRKKKPRTNRGEPAREEKLYRLAEEAS